MDIYPASAQRKALLELMPTLGCSDTALHRDDCGEPILRGKHGHIYAVLGSIEEPKRGGFMIYVLSETSDGQTFGRWTSQGWTYAKRALTFAKLVNDGDEEGAFFLSRLPSKAEAEVIRRYCGIRKRTELSDERLARLRERGKRLTQTRRAA
jgi:hypothetical protein